MFDHVTIRVSDRAASRRFYALALGEPLYDGDFVDWGELSRGAFVLDPDGHNVEAVFHDR